MSKTIGSNDLNRIEKRAIEARAIAPLLRAMFSKTGRDVALAMLQEINEQEALERGRVGSPAAGENGILQLVTEVASWGEGGVWEMDVLEETPTTYFFNVTRCPYHDKYKELGVEEFGVALSCCRDAPHARGFNPRLRLERTKTIMEGETICDFRYYLDSE